MVPILSLRSLLSLFIGLVVGVGLGLGYSSFSNANAELNAGWPPIHIVSTSNSTLYETTIQGRILPGTNDVEFIKNMDSEGQYYVAMMNSMPFFQYFTDVTSKQNPQYMLTPEKLSQMITVTYVTLVNDPSVIEIKASCPSAQETLFMVQTVPIVFEDYLLNQQNSLQSEDYQKKLKQIEITRTALSQAGQDLINSTVQDETPPTILTKDYITLSAKIASLQDELNSQAKQAASLLAQGVAPSGPSQTPQSTPSADAPTASTVTNPSQIDLNTRINGIIEALTMEASLAAGIQVPVDPKNPQPVATLPEPALNQAYLDIASQQYTNAINGIELTSTELSKAKVQMDQLQAEANQEKAAKDSANEQKKLAYTLATAQIASLTSQLDTQTKDLQATDQTVPASQVPKFYATSVPKDPIPSTSSKSAPILGAVLGMFCGWLVTNRRWLAGSTNMARASVDEEEDETSWQGSAANITLERMAEPEDDDWLNQGIYKPQEIPKNDDWLNVGINKPQGNADKKENDGLVASGITQRSEDRDNKDEKKKNDDWLNQGINTQGNDGKKENTDDWFAGDLDITPEGKKPKEDNEL